MTELLADGQADTARYTDIMRYPLPPLVPREEVTIQTDRWQRYQLPSPTTGRPTFYTRATTLAKTIFDDSGLTGWKIREKVAAAMRARDLWDALNVDMSGSGLTEDQAALGASYRAYEIAVSNAAKATEIAATIDLIHDLAGGADARELGSAVHDWLAEMDMGRVLAHQIPQMYQPYVESYRRVLTEAGLEAVPEYTERVVLNDQGIESIAGRIDRIYRVIETGELILGDLKTNKESSFDSAKDEYAVQLACYGYARWMLDTNGTTWSPMPEINQDYCVVIHLPSDQPERGKLVPYNLYAGGEAMVMSLEVRAMRKKVKANAFAAAHPEPSEGSRRLAQARQALLNIKEPGDPARIFEQYEDVWTDDLTRLGVSCIELLNPNTDTDTDKEQ